MGCDGIWTLYDGWTFLYHSSSIKKSIHHTKSKFHHNPYLMNKHEIMNFWDLPNVDILTQKINEILDVVGDNYNENEILNALHMNGLDISAATELLYQSTNEQKSKTKTKTKTKTKPNDTNYNIKQNRNKNQNQKQPETICDDEKDDSDSDLSSTHVQDKYNKNKNYNRQFVSSDWNNTQLPSIKKHFYRESKSITSMSAVDVTSWRNNRNMTVIGDSIPRPVRTVAEAGFPSYIMTDIKRSGFITPTPLQSQLWPTILSGRNAICITETVSDNALSFILPGIVHINAQPLLRPGDGPIVLIIVPAFETALEIEKETSKYLYSSTLKHISLCDDTRKRDQIGNLRIGAEILICMPSKLLEYLESSQTNLRRVTYLVIVEADKLLQNGYEQQLSAILTQIRPDRQILMFSRVWNRQIREFTLKYFTSNNEVQISVNYISPNADFDVEMVNINTEDNNNNNKNNKKNNSITHDKEEQDDYEEPVNDNEEQLNDIDKKHSNKKQTIACTVAEIIRKELKNSDFLSYLDNGQDMLLIAKVFDFISEINKKMINKTFKHSGNQPYTAEENSVFQEYYDDTEADKAGTKPAQQKLRFAMIAKCPDHEILRNAAAVGTGYQRWVEKLLLQYEEEMASFIVNDEETLDDDDDEKEMKLNESISQKLNKGEYVNLDEIFSMVGVPQQLEGMKDIEPKCRPSINDFNKLSNDIEKNDTIDIDECGHNLDDDGDQPMNN